MSGERVLRLERATRRYRADAGGAAFALEDVTLELESGSFTAITGRSGAGKTTLLNLAATLDRPDAGAVWLFGRDVAREPEGALARLRRERIGVVLQGFPLVEHLPAWQNVSLRFVPRGTPARERRALAAEALRRLGAEHVLDRLPRSLSGGERQRVAVARARVAAPALLVADEPTSSVDAETAAVVRDCLLELRARGSAVLVSAHDPALVGAADRVHALVEGRLAS